MAIVDPKRSPDGLDVYEMPKKNHTYVTTVDVQEELIMIILPL